MHGNFAYHLLWIGGAILLSVIMGALARQMKQPRVLGALLGGLLIGILFTGTQTITDLRSEDGIAFIRGLAELAAMLLLFKAGLEGNLHSILDDARFGWKVAVIGVLLPMGLGAAYLLTTSDFDLHVALFQGGVFAATSVGITAAVLGEIGVLKESYARTIISAAVIDDVLGLCVLSICITLNQPDSVDIGTTILQLSGAGLFIVIVPIVGHRLAPRLISKLATLDAQAREAIVISFMILYGAAALAIGLAAIIGAYFAGVALEEVYFQRKEHDAQVKPVEEFIDNLITAFGPIFFVYAGCIINPTVFLNASVLVHGIAFTLIAVLGKLACGCVLTSDRLIVGVGMVPRGEVGIIFATIGLQQHILTQELFGASMIMVLMTTIMTPPLLSLLIGRKTTRIASV